MSAMQAFLNEYRAHKRGEPTVINFSPKPPKQSTMRLRRIRWKAPVYKLDSKGIALRGAFLHWLEDGRATVSVRASDWKIIRNA